MRPIHSLIFVAVMIAVIWRVEIQLRGWGGLTWIGYQHLAIPLGGFIYLVWIRIVTKSRSHSWRMVLYAAGWGAGANLVLSAFADAYFGGYWSYLTTVIYLGSLDEMIDFQNYIIFVHWVSPLIWGLTLLLLYAGLSFLFRIPLATWLKGLALWMASWHLGLIIIYAIPERGSVDLIHALKTGWMIPFCVIAVGLPFLPMRKKGGEKVSQDQGSGLSVKGLNEMIERSRSALELDKRYRSPILVSAFFQMVILVFASFVMDYGTMVNVAGLSLVPYWVLVVWIIFARPSCPSKPDLLAIQYGYPGIFAGLYFFALISGYPFPE